MSPQDAMMHLKNMHNGAGAGGDPFKEGPYPKGKNPSVSSGGAKSEMSLEGSKSQFVALTLISYNLIRSIWKLLLSMGPKTLSNAL